MSSSPVSLFARRTAQDLWPIARETFSEIKSRVSGSGWARFRAFEMETNARRRSLSAEASPEAESGMPAGTSISYPAANSSSLVVRVTKNSRQRAESAKGLLDMLGANLLGVVVNRDEQLDREARRKRDHREFQRLDASPLVADSVAETVS